MIEAKSRVRKWGRSLGVVLPKESIEREGIEENDEITILISKKRDALKQTFGTLKLKKSTDEILNESDGEAWDE